MRWITLGVMEKSLRQEEDWTEGGVRRKKRADGVRGWSQRAGIP